MCAWGGGGRLEEGGGVTVLALGYAFVQYAQLAVGVRGAILEHACMHAFVPCGFDWPVGSAEACTQAWRLRQVHCGLQLFQCRKGGA